MFDRHKYNVSDPLHRTYKGRCYRSKAEMIRASQLDLLKRCGEIKQWVYEPKFALGCPENIYIPDFQVELADGTIIIEEVKGVETPMFKKNKRLWRVYGLYPLHILKAKSGKMHGWNRTVLLPEGATDAN